MSQEKRRAIASLGGIAGHAQGKAHTWTKEEASRAGRKGGHHPKQKGQHTHVPHAGSPAATREPGYVTPHEAAVLLHVSYRTIRR
ncbi:MAG TPA: hypothetical protein VEL49_10130 [Ktedonobacteraceae bacterium]|nr:hypothetical protein [Ktedonobacteraceae bacterium]